MKFTATTGTRVIVITACYLALLMWILTRRVWFITDNGNLRGGLYVLTSMLIVLAVAAFQMVLDYRVTDDALVIRRPLSYIRLRRSYIGKVEILPAGVGFVWRAFGIGGLLSFTGDYYNSRFGRMKWYRTRLDKTVLITTVAGRKIIVSPDDPESFVATLA
jgi:hypothetical protein